MCQRVLRFTLLLAFVLLAAACGETVVERAETDGVDTSDASADSPADAVQGMLALAKAGDWSVYVSRYYGETHKMDNPDQQSAQIAAKLKAVADTLIKSLEACRDQTPTLSDEGDKAVFPNGFTLYRDSGRWGFHL